MKKKRNLTERQMEANRATTALWRAAHAAEVRAYRKAYRAAHRDEMLRKDKLRSAKNYSLTKDWRFVQRLRSLYGLSLAEYETMLLAQGGVCKICGTPKPGGPGHFPVDHDHVTGKVRGLLCHRCNAGLAFFRDDQSILGSAMLYLRGVI